MYISSSNILGRKITHPRIILLLHFACSFHVLGFETTVCQQGVSEQRLCPCQSKVIKLKEELMICHWLGLGGQLRWYFISAICLSLLSHSSLCSSALSSDQGSGVQGSRFRGPPCQTSNSEKAAQTAQVNNCSYIIYLVLSPEAEAAAPNLNQEKNVNFKCSELHPTVYKLSLYSNSHRTNISGADILGKSI